MTVSQHAFDRATFASSGGSRCVNRVALFESWMISALLLSLALRK